VLNGHGELIEQPLDRSVQGTGQAGPQTGACDLEASDVRSHTDWPSKPTDTPGQIEKQPVHRSMSPSRSVERARRPAAIIDTDRSGSTGRHTHTTLLQHRTRIALRPSGSPRHVANNQSGRRIRRRQHTRAPAPPGQAARGGTHRARSLRRQPGRVGSRSSVDTVPRRTMAVTVSELWGVARFLRSSALATREVGVGKCVSSTVRFLRF
jgi:hypothetical protein